MLTLIQLKRLNSISLKDQNEIVNSGDQEHKDALAARRDLDKKTYDKLIISGTLTKQALLQRENLSAQEQLALSDCELSKSDLRKLMAKPELKGDTIISLIQNEYFTPDDILNKSDTLTFAEQVAVCMTGSTQNRMALLNKSGLDPATVTLLANLGTFEKVDGTFCKEFIELAKSDEYQTAFAKSYRKSILNYLMKLPTLCRNAYFALANNRPLDPDYASYKTELILRPECPIEILAFFANVPQKVKAFDHTKSCDLKELLNVAAILCGDDIKFVKNGFGMRYHQYRNLKLLLSKQSNKQINNTKTTTSSPWTLFTQSSAIVKALKRGEMPEDISVHIYDAKEFFAEIGYSKSKIIDDIIVSRLNRVRSIETLPERATNPEGCPYLIDGVYKITPPSGGTCYAIVYDYEPGPAKRVANKDFSHAQITIYGYRDIFNQTDAENLGYFKQKKYDEFCLDPEAWRANRFKEGISQYLKTVDPAEQLVYNADRDTWIANHPDAHWTKEHPDIPKITRQILQENHCYPNEPTKPDVTEYSVCQLVDEIPNWWPKHMFLSTFKACNPVFVGWSPNHFKINNGPKPEIINISDPLNETAKFTTTEIKPLNPSKGHTDYGIS